MALGVLSLPVLADGFCSILQPIGVSQQGDQFDGAKKFHHIWPGLAERTQVNGSGQTNVPASLTNIIAMAAGSDFGIEFALAIHRQAHRIAAGSSASIEKSL